MRQLEDEPLPCSGQDLRREGDSHVVITGAGGFDLLRLADEGAGLLSPFALGDEAQDLGIAAVRVVSGNEFVDGLRDLVGSFLKQRPRDRREGSGIENDAGVGGLSFWTADREGDKERQEASQVFCGEAHATRLDSGQGEDVPEDANDGFSKRRKTRPPAENGAEKQP